MGQSGCGNPGDAVNGEKTERTRTDLGGLGNEKTHFSYEQVEFEVFK